MITQLELIKTNSDELGRIKSLIGKFPFNNITYETKGIYCLIITFDSKYLKQFFELGVATGRINQIVESNTNLIEGDSIFFSNKKQIDGK